MFNFNIYKLFYKNLIFFKQKFQLMNLLSRNDINCFGLSIEIQPHVIRSLNLYIR